MAAWAPAVASRVRSAIGPFVIGPFVIGPAVVMLRCRRMTGWGKAVLRYPPTWFAAVVLGGTILAADNRQLVLGSRHRGKGGGLEGPCGYRRRSVQPAHDKSVAKQRQLELRRHLGILARRAAGVLTTDAWRRDASPARAARAGTA